MFFIGFGTLLATTTVENQASASPVTGFNPGMIIDDSIFTNNNSMTTSQIQAFLNSKVPNCDTNGTQPASDFGYPNMTHAQYAAMVGWPGPPYKCLKNYTENGLTAAQIISNVANQYSINPQVLIVLLQKEQSLVTDTWPLPSQYQAATGYGCPDGSSCSSQYYGLTNQLTWAGKMFRAILNQSSTWYSPYVLGNNYIQWNPNASCGGSTVDIQNLSTVALYDYTPYQPNQAALNAGWGTGDSCSSYGNRNFYLYFTSWFGSTNYPQPVGGSLLYQSSTGNIYLVTGTTRYYVPSWNVLTNYGLNTYPAVPVSDTTINQYTDGGTLTNLVYDSTSGGVYLINNRTRYYVSPTMCTAWGLSCYDSSVVLSLGSDFQTEYLQQGWSLSNLAASGGVIYEMNSGQRQPVANPSTLQSLSLSSNPILVTSPVNSGQPLGSLLMTTPGVISFTPNQTIYYYDGSNYYTVPGMTSYSDWALQNQPQLSAPASSYNTTPPSSQQLTPWYKDSSGNEYIIDGGRRVQIPTNLQSLWSSQTFSSQPSTLANSLPQSMLQSFVWSNPNIYSLSNGTKHYVPTWSDYLALGINTQNTTNLGADKLSAVPQGNDALGNGLIVSLSDNPQKLYVVNNGQLVWVPNTSVYNAYGFSWGGILTYPSSITSDYPTASYSLGNSSYNGSYYIPSGNTLYTVPSNLASDFGVIGSQFQPISGNLVNNRATTLSRFLYDTSNGNIYYASGGAIHYVATNNALVAYGGTRTPVTPIPDSDISLFTLGQTLY